MVTTSDAQRAAYESSLETATDYDEIAFPTWCVEFADLADGTYRVMPLVTDDDGDVAARRDHRGLRDAEVG